MVLISVCFAYGECLLLFYIFECEKYTGNSWISRFSQFVETSNNLLLQTGVLAMTCLLPFLFLICYVGEIVTTVYLDLADAIYEISWYLCPVREQFYIIPMLLHADKPIYFESIGSLNCSHEAFAKVIFLNYSIAIFNHFLS